ncbi:MAG: hypothetical protein R3212_00940 [Xanthomonadales bacterium]|nr:hypothetical protein [Xanthomonadales bacterium]
MFKQGIAAARLLLSVTFNALGLVVLLAVAWFLPQFLGAVVHSGVVAG